MITVAGSGAFGTALAISLASNGPVALWSHDPEHVARMRVEGINERRLPGVPLPEQISLIDQLDHLPQNAPILLAVPMQKLRQMVTDHADGLRGRILVACCKGIELATGLGPVAILSEVLDCTPAILTGPSFAHDIATGLPTALTLACADEQAGVALQKALTTPNLRLYRTTDTIGAELGGALKNVMAIACGAVIGAGLGDSARAALMTRGYAEMLRMAVAMGAQQTTLSGLSGFGDLVLTCTSTQSRNFRFGASLGRNELFDPTLTVEGAATARAVLTRAEQAGIDMPITQSVVALLDGDLQVSDAMTMLLSRPLKEE